MPHLAHKRHPITDSVERDIKTAVDRLTSSIHEEMTSTDHSDDHGEERTKPPRRPTEADALEKKKRRYLWFFVSVLALTVFAIWFINVATVIFDVRHGDSQEKHLYEEANQAIQNAFASFSLRQESPPHPTTETPSTSTIETITDTLKQIFKNTTSTTPSSTPE